MLLILIKMVQNVVLILLEAISVSASWISQVSAINLATVIAHASLNLWLASGTVWLIPGKSGKKWVHLLYVLNSSPTNS